jgi:hypothetical protein
VRVGLLDGNAFADRAVESLEGEGVRRAIERELVGALPEGVTPRQRRLIESVTDDVIRSDAFRGLLRQAAVELHSAFLAGDDRAAALRLDAVIPVIEDALPANAPTLARFARRQLDGEVLTLRRGTAEGDAVARMEPARTLGVVLPIVAVALFLAALAVAVPRRRALLWIGTSVAIVGVLAPRACRSRARSWSTRFGRRACSAPNRCAWPPASCMTHSWATCSVGGWCWHWWG